jgi:hypothetical protein
MIIFDSIEIIHLDGDDSYNNNITTRRRSESRWTMSVDDFELLGRPSITCGRQERQRHRCQMVFDTRIPNTTMLSLPKRRTSDKAGQAFHLFHSNHTEKEKKCFFDRMASSDSSLAQPLTKPRRRVSDPTLESSTAQTICTKQEKRTIEGSPAASTTKVTPGDWFALATHAD